MRDSTTGRFLPGQSPNPSGRPRGRGLQAEIERTLSERSKGTCQTRLERIAQILVSKAEEGDLKALELILKRLWPEKLALQGDALPLVIVRDFSGKSLIPGNDVGALDHPGPIVDITLACGASKTSGPEGSASEGGLLPPETERGAARRGEEDEPPPKQVTVEL